jgi:hypothetical protein
MAFDPLYRRQAALLIRILPLVAEEECFALKGSPLYTFWRASLKFLIEFGAADHLNDV